MTTNNYKPKVVVDPEYKIDEKMYRNVDLNELVNPQDNVLLGYDNVTWNITLYATTHYDLLVKNKDPNADISRIVIARSGVTGRYAVNSMKFNQVYPGTPGKTTNNTALTFDIEIKEQNGMRFFDELVALSNGLGYYKFADIPMMIDLEFIGFNKDTGVPTTIPGTNRSWQIRILNITAKTAQTSSSMVYNISAVPCHTHLEENFTILKEHTSFPASNVADYVQCIEDKLNGQMNSLYPYLPALFPSEFSTKKYIQFHIHQDLIGLQIRADSKTDAVVGAQRGIPGSKEFSHSPNQTLQSALDSMMDCVSGSDSEKRLFIHIMPVATYVGYDGFRGISVYKYDVYLLPYQTGDMKDLTEVATEFDIRYFIDKIVDKISTNADAEYPVLNIKRYDYIFSGRNDEILNLEIKFDTQFLLAVERNADSLKDLDNSSGVSSNDHLTDSQQFNAGINYMVAVRGQPSRDAVASGVPVYAMSGSDQYAYNKYDEVMKQARQKNNDITMTKSEQDRMYDGMKPTDTYLEDYREEYDLTEMDPFLAPTRIDIIPMDYKNTKETNSGTKNENTTSYEQERRLIRSNYYNRSFMLKLDMKVYGDPYWINTDQHNLNNRIATVMGTSSYKSSLNTVSPDTAEFLTCEPYMLLNLHPSREIDDNTGVLTTDKPTVFSQNIYRVLTILHEFNATGKFTQQISGVLLARGLNKED